MAGATGAAASRAHGSNGRQVEETLEIVSGYESRKISGHEIGHRIDR